MDLGEYVMGENSDPDCTQRRVCAPKKITRKIDKIIIHEGFSASQRENDIALIRLEKPVPLHTESPTKSISSPICLPWNGHYAEQNDRVVIAGFGQVTKNGLGQNPLRMNKNVKTMRKAKLRLCSDVTDKFDTALCGTGSRGN